MILMLMQSSSKIVKPIVPFKITINMISNILCY